METETSNKLIVRYLLGGLPEAEQVRLEERAFAERAFLRDIEAAENDLIDDYVRGALTETERQQFERRFLSSAERQKKVEFARALAHVVPAVAAQPATTHWWDAWLALFRGRHLAWQFSMATAAVLLVLGIAWVFTVSRGLRTQVEQLQAQQQTQQQQEEALRQQAASERARSEELTAQLERERAHSQELARQLARDQAQQNSLHPPLLLSLFLPAVVRGDDQRPTLTLPPAAQTVRLQIGLERGDDFKSYRVELALLPGPPVWKRAQLRPQGRVLSLSLPAQLLRAGQYEVKLQGVTATQQTEDVRFYYFDVQKK